MGSLGTEFWKGILKDNPVFVQILGLCPFLAVSNALNNAIGMGAAVIFVLLGSNIIVSIFRNKIPSKIRIPAFIVVIASFVTMVRLFMAAFTPSLNKALGIFIPLIVVNCAILGRAEAFASRNKPFKSIVDALGMGIGFTLALGLISFIRELFGTGGIEFFGTQLFQINLQPALIFILPPGALLTMGLLLGLFNVIKKKQTLKLGCNHNCEKCKEEH